MPEQTAYADDLATAEADLADAERRLEELQVERSTLEQDIASLQAEIDVLLPQVMSAQDEYSESLGRLRNSLVFHYKLEGVTLYDMVLSTESFPELLKTVNYLEIMERKLGEDAEAKSDNRVSLEIGLAKLNKKKTEQVALQEELAAKEAEARQLHDDAAARVDELAVSSAGAGAADAPAGATYSTGVMDGTWQVGLASAYSFADNDGWDATASGIPLDWTSYTVAVPMSQRYLLGHSVEISYNGMSLVAMVTDVGGFAGYGRALDLAPGVWRAFGCSSPSDWGIRQVAYRFL